MIVPKVQQNQTVAQIPLVVETATVVKRKQAVTADVLFAGHATIQISLAITMPQILMIAAVPNARVAVEPQ